MPYFRLLRRPFLLGSTLAMTAALIAIEPASATFSSAVRIVLQEGRQYNPADLFLRKGDTITIINGDDSAVHHAFIEADRFTLDAGEQEPGQQATLRLNEPGDFILRCGVHPKMKLTVHVQ